MKKITKHLAFTMFLVLFIAACSGDSAPLPAAGHQSTDQR